MTTSEKSDERSDRASLVANPLKTLTSATSRTPIPWAMKELSSHLRITGRSRHYRDIFRLQEVEELQIRETYKLRRLSC